MRFKFVMLKWLTESWVVSWEIYFHLYKQNLSKCFISSFLSPAIQFTFSSLSICVFPHCHSKTNPIAWKNIGPFQGFSNLTYVVGFPMILLKPIFVDLFVCLINSYSLTLSWQGRLLARAGDYATAANIYQKVLESWYARGSLHYFVQ